ncbi:Rieske (2Fe-2S) protein [Tropicimonas marinistellae]|uniref:Rieske (2Fe-2S) protein n=1 Tax=Tropicimonas marinistellae TaxID=1739787 RepID=UPI000836B97E|nr:Rieske 2Fe-2S domain-containing protein [Tropicimonas marinistellae]
MSDDWKSYPGAPADGTVICPLADVPEAGTASVDLEGFPVLLARSGGRLVAYVNACPHQFLPLDYRRGSVLSADGKVLRCSNHEAGFELETGKGVDGFGVGCSLDPVPVEVTGDGLVRIGESGADDQKRR